MPYLVVRWTIGGFGKAPFNLQIGHEHAKLFQSTWGDSF